ncbi:MAG: peptidylprolyl isomerase, partial [Thiobacillus sp.]|nr:peptidylprolyl isomerase [Thiobacillus sp.]
MKAIIEANKYVELTYKVIDRKTRQVLTQVEFPLGYVHGVNTILSPRVMDALEGKSEGDLIEVHIDCNDIYG